MNMELNLKVIGSSDNIYDIQLLKTNEDVTFICSCSSSGFSPKEVCKHRLALLACDFSKLLDVNENEIKQLREFISSISITQELSEIKNIENKLESLQKEYKSNQKKLKNEISQKKENILHIIQTSNM